MTDPVSTATARQRPSVVDRGKWSAGKKLSAAVIFCSALFAVRLASGDLMTLQSGIVLDGQAGPVHGLAARTARTGAKGKLPEPWWGLDDGVRRYFALARLTQVEQRQDLSRIPEFTIPQLKHGHKGPDVIGSSTATPWDEYGHRTITLKTAKNNVDIVQEINRLRPDYVEINSTTHNWTMGLDTRLIPSNVLHAVLDRAARKGNIDDRKAIIQFFIDARRFDDAKLELENLLKSHPELKEWGEPQLPLINELKYRAAINEVQRRRKVGQHQLAFLTATEALKADVPADSLLQCQEIVNEYNTARDNAGQIQMLLELYEAELTNDEAASLRPLRPQLLRELNVETLPRLEPFRRAINDKGLTPSQKLALAYSGWIVGPSFADTDLKVATNLWQARFLALEFIRASDNPLRRDEFVADLKKLEGVTMERLAELVPLLPYVFEPQPPAPGEPRTYKLNLEDGLAVTYAITLPLEYNPAHSYPAIVALRRSGMSLDETLKWWAGTKEAWGVAMNRGYIVIAPEFAPAAAEDYDYDVDAHRKVVAALIDARQKFSIDSDRVFIAGHQLGGDAAFDIALSHPDLFAGAAPFVARMDRYSRLLIANGALFPWYIVTGERHLPAGTANVDVFTKSLESINSMAIRHDSEVDYRPDVTYVEYRARGFESYFEELPRLFDWMDAHRRKSLRDVRDGWKVEMLRPISTRYFWIETKELPAKLTTPINWSSPSGPGVQPARFEASIGSENIMYVTLPQGRSNTKARGTIWLAPQFFEFEKRLHLKVNTVDRLNELIDTDAAALLDDFRKRADRQQLYWAKVDL